MYVEVDEGIHSVLIVEDEGLVALMMEDLVRELGVRQVHICGDVATALHLVRTAEIDCAVLDLWVRDGSSTAVADALDDRDVPFLFSTGTDAAALDDRHAGRPVINKPFADDDFKLALLDTWSFHRDRRRDTVREPRRARVATPVSTD